MGLRVESIRRVRAVVGERLRRLQSAGDRLKVQEGTGEDRVAGRRSGGGGDEEQRRPEQEQEEQRHARGAEHSPLQRHCGTEG